MANRQRRDPTGPRQLTIGECIAIGRYGPTIVMEGDRRAHMDAILAFIDRIEVCTTCGWSRELHRVNPGGVRVMHICDHWTRDL
jgi:ribosomal protein L32